MKKTSALLLVLILSITLLAGCSGNSNNDGGNSGNGAGAAKASIVGQWTYDIVYEYTFNEDGSGELKDSYKFTYVYAEDTGTLTLSIEDMTGDFVYTDCKLEGDVLKMTDGVGSEMVLNRKK